MCWEFSSDLPVLVRIRSTSSSYAGLQYTSTIDIRYHEQNPNIRYHEPGSSFWCGEREDRGQGQTMKS